MGAAPIREERREGGGAWGWRRKRGLGMVHGAPAPACLEFHGAARGGGTPPWPASRSRTTASVMVAGRPAMPAPCMGAGLHLAASAGRTVQGFLDCSAGRRGWSGGCSLATHWPIAAAERQTSRQPAGHLKRRAWHGAATAALRRPPPGAGSPSMTRAEGTARPAPTSSPSSAWTSREAMAGWVVTHHSGTAARRERCGGGVCKGAAAQAASAPRAPLEGQAPAAAAQAHPKAPRR